MRAAGRFPVSIRVLDLRYVSLNKNVIVSVKCISNGSLGRLLADCCLVAQVGELVR